VRSLHFVEIDCIYLGWISMIGDFWLLHALLGKMLMGLMMTLIAMRDPLLLRIQRACLKTTEKNSFDFIVAVSFFCSFLVVLNGHL